MKSIFSRFSKRERLLFGSTFSIIAAVCLYIFIAEPLYKKWSEINLEFESADSKLFKNLKLLAEKDKLEKEYTGYQEYTQKGGGEEEIPSVLKEIESAALNCGVQITSMKPKDVKDFKRYKKLTIEVIAEADINQLMRFMYNLEASKKLLKVERLVVSLKGTKPNILKGTMLIRKISFL